MRGLSLEQIRAATLMAAERLDEQHEVEADSGSLDVDNDAGTLFFGGGNVLESNAERPKITVPNGIRQQKQCIGDYVLVSGMSPNGRPVWKHTRRERWFYLGTDSCWYVGSNEELKQGSACSEGLIRHGELPHELGDHWETFNVKSDCWV